MSAGSGRIACFDVFEFDLHTLELRRAGVPVRLQQQPARLLAVLVEHAGELVTRDMLRRAIWGEETHVDFERGLNYCVNQIRAALGDTAEAPRLVETLRGRGYRFVGALAGEPAAPSPRIALRAALVAAALALAAIGSWGAWRATHARPLAAIGVAPLSAPDGERPWAAALHSQLVSRLSAASRTPVVDLASQPATGVSPRWRVEGRVDRSAAQYRVTMLLRDTRDGSVPWSDVFAGSPGDWIDAQSEMAERVTEIIRYRIEGPSAGLPKRRQRLPDRLAQTPH